MKKILFIIKLIYLPVSLSFILYFIWVNQQLLVKMINVANLCFLALAVVLWGVLHFLAPLSTGIIFSCMGTNIPYSKLLKIYISKLPAKYLPGGIWHTVGRLSDYHYLGIPKRQLSILAIVDTFSPCLITFLLGGGYLWLFSKHMVISTIEGLLALISLCTLILLPFFVKKPFVVFGRKKFIEHYISLILLSFSFWFLASISFIFYYSSVSFNTSHLSLPHIAATYIFSWGIGYISIFAPQGIGVFEVVAGKLMEFPISLGGAVAFLAGFRVIALMADIAVWIVYFLFGNSHRKQEVI
jgi:hypothetical protein